MKLRLLIVFAAVSFVLLILTSVFWVRSYWIGDSLLRYYPPRIFDVISNDGLICISWGEMVSQDYPPPTGWQGSFWPFRRDADTIEADLSQGTTLGFKYERWQRRTPTYWSDGRLLTLPYWLFLLCFAIAPTTMIWRWVRHRHRKREGHCESCGYDLRATAERCPECGMMISQS